MNFLKKVAVLALFVSQSLSAADSSDECSRRVKDVRQMVNCCMDDLDNELFDIKEMIKNAFPCNSPVAISRVPIIIDEPGHYCVVNDLFFTGPGAAIVIESPNVSFDFNGHVLIIDPEATVGIAIQNMQNVAVHNGTIMSLAPSANYANRGIFCINDQQIAIDNMSFENTFLGVAFGDYDFTLFQATPGVTNGKITNCFFNLPCPASAVAPIGMLPAGVQAAVSKGIYLDNNVFGQIGLGSSSVGTGFSVLTNCKNTSITNCQFVNSYSSTANGIAITGTTGLANQDISSGTLISDCTFYNCNQDISFNQNNNLPIDAVVTNCASGNANNFLSCSGSGLYVEKYVGTANSSTPSLQLVQLGASGLPASDIIFNSCSFSAPQLVSSASLFNAAFASGLLVQECIFDANGGVANVSFGLNAKMTNCVARSTNTQYGIVIPSGASEVFIEECLLDGGVSAVISLQGTQSVVNNCNIRNGAAEGVDIAPLSQFNTVTNCSISKNGAVGIFLSATSDFNYITNNKLSNNATGINNAGGSHSQIYSNESCSNTTVNCIGLSVSSPPGSTTFQLGQNICCP